MKFKKRMSVNVFIFAADVILGMAMAVLGFAGIIENDFFQSFGAALAVAGIVKLIQYIRIIKNEKVMEKYETSAKDERNIMLSMKAKSTAYTIFILLAAVAIIVLSIFNMHYVVNTIAYTVCGLVLIYLICYYIFRRIY